MIRVTVELIKLSAMTQVNMDLEFESGVKFSAKPVDTQVSMAGCLEMFQRILSTLKENNEDNN